MPLRQDESVICPQVLVVDQHHRVQTREITAEMPHLGAIVHIDQATARFVERDYG
jgi:hypothetical protein